MKINLRYVFIQKFISVFIPLFFIFTVHSFLSEAISNFFKFNFNFVLISFISLFFSSLVFSVIDVLKLRTLSKTRVIIFALIFVYLILIIFNNKPFPQRFILDGKGFYILFLNFAYWLLDFYFESTFSVWNYFLEISEGKSGENLYRTLREDEILMEKSVSAIRSLKTISSIFVFLIAFIILISWLNSYKFSIRSICMFISMVCMHFILCAYIKNSLDELRFAGMGIASVFQLAIKRLFATFIILLFSFSIAFLISPGKKIIDKNYKFDLENSFVVKIIYFLSNIFPDGDNKLHQVMHEELPDVLLPSMGDSGVTPEELEKIIVDNTDNSERLREIINKIIVFISIFILVLFLFLPLFSKKFRNFIKENKLFKILKSFVMNIKDFFINLFTTNSKKISLRIQTEKKLYSEFIKKTENQKISKEKKKEIGEFASIFFKVVAIGQENEIILTDSITPMEYINLMIEKFSEQKEELYKIGFLFEKALYSKECLFQEEKTEYNEAYNKFVGSTSTSI